NRKDGRTPQDTVRGARGLSELLGVLGLTEPRTHMEGPPSDVRDRVVALIHARADARAQRDWKRADEMRAQLAQLEVTVKDTPDGTDWEWKGRGATEPRGARTAGTGASGGSPSCARAAVAGRRLPSFRAGTDR